MEALCFGMAAAAAVLHVFIFYLEVFAWEGPLARKIFGPQSAQELALTKFYAYNQGVYNLALSLIVLLGLSLSLMGQSAVGLALQLAGCGAMLLAAVALGVASAPHRSAAAKQGIFPLLALVLGLLTLG